MTLNYDTSGVGQNGVPTAHMLPAATLAQYSRHYGQAVPGYSVPGAPWVTPYLVQAGPPHMQQVDVSLSYERGRRPTAFHTNVNSSRYSCYADDAVCRS